jgi:hypothetical protein
MVIQGVNSSISQLTYVHSNFGAAAKGAGYDHWRNCHDERKRGLHLGRGVLDEVEDDVNEPASVVVIAVFAVACAAIVFASLPALVALGLLAIRPEELAGDFAGLAVGVCGVLGAVKLVAAAWHSLRRFRPGRPTISIATSAD